MHADLQRPISDRQRHKMGKPADSTFMNENYKEYVSLLIVTGVTKNSQWLWKQ